MDFSRDLVWSNNASHTTATAVNKEHSHRSSLQSAGIYSVASTHMAHERRRFCVFEQQQETNLIICSPQCERGGLISSYETAFKVLALKMLKTKDYLAEIEKH